MIMNRFAWWMWIASSVWMHAACNPREDGNFMMDTEDDFEYESVPKDSFSEKPRLLFELEHNLPIDGRVGVFESRGNFEVDLLDPTLLKFHELSALNDVQKKNLQEKVKKNEFYTIRARTDSNDPNSPYVIASIPACHLVLSKLDGHVAVHLSEDNKIIGLEYRALTSTADVCPSTTKLSGKAAFSTSGTVISSVQPPKIPNVSAASAQAPPGVKKTKKDAEQAPEENQGFFRKYWYIIVPVMLFSLFGGKDPQAGGQQQGSAPASGAPRR